MLESHSWPSISAFPHPQIQLTMNYVVLYVFTRRRQWHPTPVLLPGKSHGWRSLVGCSPWGRRESDTTEQLHFLFHALEMEMATHSSVLAWRIPGTGGPGGLPSMGLRRVGHDWSDLVAAAYVFTGKKKKQPCIIESVWFKPMLFKGQLYFVFIYVFTFICKFYTFVCFSIAVLPPFA